MLDLSDVISELENNPGIGALITGLRKNFDTKTLTFPNLLQ